jgi:uncharacterized protein
MTSEAPSVHRVEERPPGRWRRFGPLALAAAVWVAALTFNEPVWDLVVYRWAGMSAGTRLGSAVHFFLADTVKITLLLVGIIFAVTVARSFITLERI